MANDLTTLIQQTLSFPGVREALEPLLQSMLGSPGYGLTWLSSDPTKTLMYNVESHRRSSTFNSRLRPGFDQTVDTVGQTFLAKTYQLMGFDPAAAAEAAGNRGILNDAINAFLIAPQLKSAYNDIGNALYNRSAEWDPTVSYSNSANRDNYWNAGSQLLNEVIQGAANREFAGMNVGDVGALAAQMVGVGAFSEGGASQKVDDRINKFKRELKSYAHSINALQDVIDGPLEDILSSFEEMTGNKLVSMSSGRVASIATATRNILSQGVINQQGLANLTARQYGLIAPFGGTMAQAHTMALRTAAALSYGVRIEGLSDEEAGEALAQQNARNMVNGVTRQYAAAYKHYQLSTGQEDNDTTKDKFFREMRNKYGGARQEHIAKYLAENNVDNAFISSRTVGLGMADPRLQAEANGGAYERYKEITNSFVDQTFANKSEEAKKQIKDVLQNTADRTRAMDILQQKGLITQAERGTLENTVGVLQMSAAQISDPEQAAFAIHSDLGARNEMARSAGGDILRKLFGAKSTGYGFEGLVNAMMSNNMGGFDFGKAFGSMFGLNYDDSMNIAEKIDKEWKDAGDDPRTREQVLRNRMTEMYGAAGIENPAASAEYDLTVMQELGETGIKIMTAQGKTGVSREQLIKDKSNLLALARRDKYGKYSPVTRAQYTEATKNMEIDQKTLDKMFLAQGSGREVSDKELSDFEKARKEIDEQRGAVQGKGKEADAENARRDEAARAILQAKTSMQAIRAEYQKKYGKTGTVEDIKKYIKDTEGSVVVDRFRSLRDSASGKGKIFENADAFTNEATKQDGIQNILGQILDWLKDHIK